MSGVQFFLDQSNFAYPKHIHKGFNVDIVISGFVEYQIGPRTFLVHPGSVIWIDRHEVHSARFHGKDRVVIRSFFLSESFVGHLASDLGVAGIDHLVHPVIEDQGLLTRLNWIHQSSEKACDSMAIESQLVESFSSLLASRSSNHRVVGKAAREHHAVNIVKEFMLSHYHEPLSLLKLAEVADLSREYLVRVFRRHVGLSPHTYLNAIRIAKARNLLIAGMPPAEVAAAVGLADQSHLTRMFKRNVGTTPSVFARVQSTPAPVDTMLFL